MATLQPAAPRTLARPDADGRPRALRESGRGLGVRRTVVRVSRMLMVALVFLAVGALGTLQVLQSSHVASVGYEIRTLERARADLSAGVAQLEAQVATRSSLEHVHAEAVNRLGMVRPLEVIAISVDVPAPSVVPLPRRYVTPYEPIESAQPGRLERLLGTLPGFD